MPLYNYRCPECSKEKEEFIHSVHDRDALIMCDDCGIECNRILSPGIKHTFAVGSFFEPYIDTDIRPDGKPIQINSQQQFFAECEKHGRGYRPIRDKLR
jgi:putative FmdB family regulatory protein